MRIELLDNNTEKPDHNLPGRGKREQVDNNFLRALLHFLCCGKREALNVVLCDNPKYIKKTHTFYCCLPHRAYFYYVFDNANIICQILGMLDKNIKYTTFTCSNSSATKNILHVVHTPDYAIDRYEDLICHFRLDGAPATKIVT